MATGDLDLLRARLGDRYVLERVLGRGGMGTVVLAHDRRLDRPVALKVLSADVADDPDLRERFARETRVAASFSHPNIVPVFGIEEGEGFLAYAMGFVEGESVADRIARGGPLPARELVRLLLDVAYALAYAHGREVVHRDLKPDNVMLERATGRALLMDFGIARRMTPAPAAGLTRVGEVVGTPEYMSPEQIAGEAVDGRSDLYSLGLVAWCAATGTSFMDAPSTMQVMTRQLTETPPPLATVRTDLPAALCEAVDACLAKDPAARPTDARALVALLERAQEAAPEIPVAMRTLVQELGTLGLITVFVLQIALLAGQLLGRDTRNDADALVPMVVLTAILITRWLQAASDVRQLAGEGWARDDVPEGIRAVLAERDALRALRRADPEQQRGRRIVVRVAAGMLVQGLVCVAIMKRLQTPIPGGGFRITSTGIFFGFTGIASFAVAAILFLRNPFRRPLTEKLFALTWLGAPGRAFLALAWPRRAATARSGRVTASVTAPVTAPRTAAARVAPTPMTPRPAAPLAVTPVTPTPVTPTPVTPTPVTPTPVTPTPVTPTPVTTTPATTAVGDGEALLRLGTLLDGLERRVAALEASRRHGG